MTMISRRALPSLLLLCVTLLCLCGCKPSRQDRDTDSKDGGATPMQMHSIAAPSLSTADQQILDDGRPVIACFGDSLTAGYGLDVSDSYPSVMQRQLDAAGYRYRVVNMGISGDTTKDGLERIDGVLTLKPAIVVLEFGGNDGLRGVPVQNSRDNLDAMMARLVRTGTHVALAGMTLPPQYTAPYIQQFNATYTVLAQKYKVPMMPFMLKDVYGVDGSIQGDGIHPTAQGAKQVAKNVMELIAPLLKH